MRLLVSVLIALLAFPTFAATKMNLFDTEIIIVEQEEDARYDGEELARREGMRQVLVRATGNEAVLKNEVIRKAITRSSRYLSRLSYGEVESKSTTSIEQEFGDGPLMQPTLKMTFSSQQIKALLAQAQIPYWPEERSTVLVWIVEEGQYERDISWEQTGRTSVTALKEFAQQRGLPVIIPKGDMKDVTAIQTTELWGGFVDSISTASERYLADAVVVVKLMGSASSRKLTYTLYDDQPQYIAEPGMMPVQGEITGTTIFSMKQLVEQLGNHYALKSAAKLNGESVGSVFVQFSGLENAQHFFEVEELIGELGSVATVSLDKVQGEQVTFQVELLGTVEEFQRQILRSEKISSLIAPTTEQKEPVDGDSMVQDEIAAENLVEQVEESDLVTSPDTATNDTQMTINENEGEQSFEMIETTGEDSMEDEQVLNFLWSE